MRIRYRIIIYNTQSRRSKPWPSPRVPHFSYTLWMTSHRVKWRCHPLLNQSREWNWRHRLNEPNVPPTHGGGGGRCPQKLRRVGGPGWCGHYKYRRQGRFCHDTNRPFEDNFLFMSTSAFTQSCFPFYVLGVKSSEDLRRLYTGSHKFSVTLFKLHFFTLYTFFKLFHRKCILLKQTDATLMSTPSLLERIKGISCLLIADSISPESLPVRVRSVCVCESYEWATPGLGRYKTSAKCVTHSNHHPFTTFIVFFRHPSGPWLLSSFALLLFTLFSSFYNLTTPSPGQRCDSWLKEDVALSSFCQLSLPYRTFGYE